MATPDLSQFLSRVQKNAPLVLCLTNVVTVTDCANALLAIGASPVMSADPQDAADLAAIAQALVINIGTISDSQQAVIDAAFDKARSRQIPIILDPVGAGATSRRLKASEKYLEGASIVRGNASEILALCGPASGQKGVDSSAVTELDELINQASTLAASKKLVVAVTGPTDIATDGQNVFQYEGSHILMTRLTGTGCVLSAVSGAYAAASPEALLPAAFAALKHLAIAGERAAAALPPQSRPILGTFKTLLFDRLGDLTPADLS
ncbi:MAG: hydroxyethylthiazole kinase [Deltaproteobacteria bacterium]|jgi:hydroxyethylthiazole kinase|nr:hydroxyethylthiazole kinase [Deltaproteobacteria bacterium]